MHLVGLLLALLLHTDCGRRLSTSEERQKPWSGISASRSAQSLSGAGQSSSELHGRDNLKTMKAASRLLMALKPRAGFHSSASDMLSSSLRATLRKVQVPSRLRCLTPIAKADAAVLAERGKKLKERLDSCALFILGVGPVRHKVYEAIMPYLKYRNYIDIGEKMVDNYNSINGLFVDLPGMIANLPIEEVEELSGDESMDAVVWMDSMYVGWDGTGREDYVHMGGQGIMVNIVSVPQVTEDEVMLPATNSKETLERWLDAKKKFCDLEIEVDREMEADDMALKVIDTLHNFLDEQGKNNTESKDHLETMQKRLTDLPHMNPDGSITNSDGTKSSVTAKEFTKPRDTDS